MRDHISKSKTSMMENFIKQQLKEINYFEKYTIVDVWQDIKYVNINALCR